MKKREDYPAKEKWQVEDIYPNEEAFNNDLKELKEKLNNYLKYQNHILDNAQNLYNLLTFDIEYSKTLEKVLTYAHLLNDQDTTNTHYQSLYGQVCNLYELYSQTTSFVTPEILKKDYSLITKYYKDEPRLKEYERILKEIFKVKPHILSSNEEALLSRVSASFRLPEEAFSYLTDADLTFGYIKDSKGEKKVLNEKSYHILMQDKDQNVRKKAFQKLYKTYGSFKNTYASLLSYEVKKNNNIALARKYNSALEASLFSNDIPTEIYSSLIDIVRNKVNLLSNYWALKKKALNLKDLHIYDTYAPIVKEKDRTFTIKEAQSLIKEALSPLGKTYQEDIMKAFSESWIDFCPNDGKRNGAYCTACYSVHPYVLLSYEGTLNNVSTLIHELGHAMHYYYAIKNQKFQDYNYSIFVAEVASQVNQILLSKYLIKNSKDKEEKKYLIDDLISDFKATIYRQTMFAEFEKKIHELDQENEVLTCDVLNDLYYKLNQDYYGENIIIDKEIKYEWMRIPHFYMDFYVYQYATAYASAIVIALNLLENKENVQEKYLKFLSLGATMDPISSLKVAGVDITDSHVFDAAFQYFDDLIKELENLF